MDFNEITRRLAEYNRDAGLFIDQILTISSVWDDLIDKDKTIDDSKVNAAFELSLVHLPRNKFYMAHFNELNPIVISSIQNWYIANKIERNNDEDKFNISFIIRSSYADLITMTAYILGGTEFSQEIGEAARAFAHDEGIEGYKQALLKEISDRGDK